MAVAGVLLIYILIGKYLNKIFKKGIYQVEDDKFETPDPLQKAYSRYILNCGKSRRKSKVDIGTHNSVNSIKATGNLSQFVSRVQTAKVIQTRYYSTKRVISESNSIEPRDLTANEESSLSGDGVGNSILNNGQLNDQNIEKKSNNKLVSTKEDKREKIRSIKKYLENQVINGSRDKKYYKLYLILSNSNFLLACYKQIKSKPGNMSKGSNDDTLDGISLKKFDDMINKLNKGSFKFSPVRRVEIPKPNKPGEYRPLGIGSPIDKIVQYGMAEILKVIYEPIFLDNSHGFRPKRSTHSALSQLYLHGGSYTWVIQGDIEKCYDRIPHELILELLAKRIGCVNFLTYVKRILSAGYIDPNTKEKVGSKVGLPQGSPISPILANIVLHEFDLYIMNELKPNFVKGIERRYNPAYDKLSKIIHRKSSTPQMVREAMISRRKLRSKNPLDPGFKRILYVRYADDFVILVSGSKSEALEIKSNLSNILKYRCRATLSDTKTLVSHLRDGFKFLGANIRKLDNKVYLVKTEVNGTKFKRKVPLKLFVTAPILSIIEKLIDKGFARRNHKGILLARGRTNLVLLDMYTIISFYNSQINGILNYYSFAGNRSSLHIIFWILRQSCALTIARKMKLTSMKKVFNKYGFDIRDPETEIQLNIPKELKVTHNYKTSHFSDWKSVLDMEWSKSMTINHKFKPCAICSSTKDVEMHHIRKVADVRNNIRTGNASWSKIQGAFLRKQVPLCRYHHKELHSGNLNFMDLRIISSYK